MYGTAGVEVTILPHAHTGCSPAPSHLVHTLDAPLLLPTSHLVPCSDTQVPQTCAKGFSSSAQITHSRHSHSQQARLSAGSALYPHPALGPPWSSTGGSFVGGQLTRFGCHAGTGHTLEVMWVIPACWPHQDLLLQEVPVQHWLCPIPR